MQGHPRWIIMVKGSDKTWSSGGGNGNPLQYSCLKNPMDSMKRHKYMTLENEPPHLKGDQYAMGEEWSTVTNSYRKTEEPGPNQKWDLVVDSSSDDYKVWFCKEQYCIITWNVKSMNRSKLEVVKQVMARVSIDILGISELK